MAELDLYLFSIEKHVEDIEDFLVCRYLKPTEVAVDLDYKLAQA